MRIMHHIKRREEMNRTYSGTIPTEEGWAKVGAIAGEVGKSQNMGLWDVYYGPVSGGGRWMKIKLVAKTKNSIKANYHLCYGLTEQRFSQTRDQKTLEEKSSVLARALANFVMIHPTLQPADTDNEVMTSMPHPFWRSPYDTKE